MYCFTSVCFCSFVKHKGRLKKVNVAETCGAPNDKTNEKSPIQLVHNISDLGGHENKHFGHCDRAESYQSNFIPNAALG